MKRSKFSEEQIVYALRQAESGTPIGEVCRPLRSADQTFYAWKKEIRARWRLVADLSLNITSLAKAGYVPA